VIAGAWHGWNPISLHRIYIPTCADHVWLAVLKLDIAAGTVGADRAYSTAGGVQTGLTAGHSHRTATRIARLGPRK